MDNFSIGIALLLLSPALFFMAQAVGRYLGLIFGKRKITVRIRAKSGERLEFTIKLNDDKELEALIQRISKKTNQDLSSNDVC